MLSDHINDKPESLDALRARIATLEAALRGSTKLLQIEVMRDCMSCNATDGTREDQIQKNTAALAGRGGEGRA